MCGVWVCVYVLAGFRLCVVVAVLSQGGAVAGGGGGVEEGCELGGRAADSAECFYFPEDFLAVHCVASSRFFRVPSSEPRAVLTVSSISATPFLTLVFTGRSRSMVVAAFLKGSVGLRPFRRG